MSYSALSEQSSRSSACHVICSPQIVLQVSHPSYHVWFGLLLCLSSGRPLLVSHCPWPFCVCGPVLHFSLSSTEVQLPSPTFLHITLLIISYQLLFLFLNPVVFKLGSQTSSIIICWKCVGNAHSCAPRPNKLNQKL